MPELVERSKVRVFKFKMYNISTDEAVISRRMGKRDAIEKMGGILIGNGVEIDEELLSKECPGLTDIDFQP